MPNERITENLVREILRDLKYYSPGNSIRVEEQKSEVLSIKKLLRGSSKTGKGGIGAPEFIITNDDDADFVVIIECKANVRHHESASREDPVVYAVDGALHYAKSMSKDYNAIAIAISGQTTSELKISTFLHPKGASNYKDLTTASGATITEFLPWTDYIKHATFDPSIQKLRHDELMAFSRQLHDFMRDHAKLTESEKPLLVSGTLIALRNEPFVKSFDAYKPEQLQKQWLTVIKEEIDKALLPRAKINNMTQPYSSIAVHPELGKPTAKYPKGVLYEIIKDLNDKVWPFISVYHDFDVVGQFYGEFLKYTGGDKKALGIVLTPRHVTDLFARIANVRPESTVVDICAGTGGFLVSAMHHMIGLAKSADQEERIKKKGLIGVENQPNMYALAASNMILRGDGKANLHQGSCFDEAISRDIRESKCDVGMLNPPFSQSDEDQRELVFIRQMLDLLEVGGVGIAIVPMSCAISPNPVREELMRHHTLEAVMSMPDELFYPVGTITCIMVWTAGIAHSISNRKTWFGYWKVDGFVKTKHKGRIDLNSQWKSIRDRWIEAFRNREVVPGQSVTAKVSFEDEWCAEAYMETDYNSMPKSAFEDIVKDYCLYLLKNDLR